MLCCSPPGVIQRLTAGTRVILHCQVDRMGLQAFILIRGRRLSPEIIIRTRSRHAAVRRGRLARTRFARRPDVLPVCVRQLRTFGHASCRIAR